MVGRPFQKGMSGNPKGRSPLPPEIRAERRSNQAALIQLVSRHWALTQEEADFRMSGPNVSRLEEAVSKTIDRAREGDTIAFKMMLEIMIGKIPEEDDDEISEEDMRILRRAKEIMAVKRAKPVESD